MKQNLKQIKTKIYELVPRLKEFRNGAFVFFDAFESYTNEAGCEVFSSQPVHAGMGVCLGAGVYGSGVANDYELCEKDFTNGVHEHGVSSEGGYDVWEYIKAEIISPIRLEDVLEALLKNQPWKEEDRIDHLVFHSWQFGKKLDEQSEETITLIGNLLEV